MRHATPEDLEELAPVLDELRGVGGLQEPRPGVFYRRSRAFLHFHSDLTGLFADVRLGEDFVRLPLQTRRQRTELLTRVRTAVGEKDPG